MRTALAILFGLSLAVAGALAFVWFRIEREPEGDLDVHGELEELFGPVRVMKTIWLERGGATLQSGGDDSTSGRASVVAKAKAQPVRIPAFDGSAREWKSFVACLRDQYAPFDVEIVERRPAERGYILAVVGGTPSVVGFPRSTAGLAPYSSRPVEDAVVLIFSKTLDENPRAMCETAAMEIAHAYGLDHEYLCKDPMTYLSGCGAKKFQNVDAPCGEKRVRRCGDGQERQNSYRRLLEVLGPRRTEAKG